MGMIETQPYSFPPIFGTIKGMTTTNNQLQKRSIILNVGDIEVDETEWQGSRKK